MTKIDFICHVYFSKINNLKNNKNNFSIYDRFEKFGFWKNVDYFLRGKNN